MNLNTRKRARFDREETNFDVQSLYSMLGDTISNPCSIAKDQNGHMKNIASGMVLPDDIVDRLLNARQEGEKLLQEFVEK